MNTAAALSDPATFARACPHSLMAELRRRGPVVWVDETVLTRTGGGRAVEMRGSGYWAVLSHAAVLEVARQPTTFSSALRGAFLADPRSPADLARTRRLLLNMDAPEHTRIRKRVAGAFKPGSVRELAPRVRAHAHRLVAAAVAAGEVDLVAAITARLPILVLAELLGVPPADHELLFQWSNALVGLDDPEIGGGDAYLYQRAYIDALAYGRDLARRRRREPAGDLVSQLAATDLTDDELGHLWLLLVVGGNESTRHYLTGALETLATSPAARARLVAAPALVPAAADELLRWVSPVMVFRRTAAAATTIADTAIAAGDKVALYFGAANRDEAVFTDPDRLDLGRSPNPHVAFGAGPHFCLGAHLARFEGIALLEALLPVLERLELLGPSRRLASNFMNGIKSLPARFGAAPPGARHG